MSNLKTKIQNSDKKSNISNTSSNQSKQNKNLVEIQINQNMDSQTTDNSENHNKKEQNISLLNKGNKMLNTNNNFNFSFGMDREILEKKINDGRHSTKIIYYMRQISTDKKYGYK